MSNYILDRAYRVEEANGVARNRVVVAGQEEDGCKYPASANAGAVIGVTMHTQLREGRAVTVRRLGIAPIEAESAIAAGDYVTVADNTGRIARATPPSALIGTQGQNSAVRYHALLPASQNPILTVTHQQTGNNTPLSATIIAGVVNIQLATDGSGDVTTTASQAIAFVNEHAELSKLIRAELGGGNGTAAAAVASTGMSGYATSINPIGIAEQAAQNEGDIIDVFLC